MKDEELLQIICELTDTNTKAIRKTTKLVFETQENVPQELLARITTNVGRVGHLSFLVGEKPIDVLDVISLPDIVEERGRKSQAQRLRAVLWRLWEKGGKVGDAETFYNVKTEAIIEHLKKQLE